MNLEEEKEGNYSYDLAGEITFHNVSVEIANKQIISNLNLSIPKGEKVAILGENGSGKSVLAKAILGFYPIDSGNIYFNYHNSKNLDNSNIRKYVDYILGEADLFTGTILENIQLGSKYTKEEITKAVEQAEIYEDIQSFEDGYQTRVGEKGVKLSRRTKAKDFTSKSFT